MKTMLNVEMSTDASGRTTIISCYREKEDAVLFSYPNSCNITFSHSDNGGAYRSVVLNMSDAGYSGMRLRGDVNSDDRFRVQANCTAGNEVSDYLRNCSLGFGWRDSSDNNSAISFIPTRSSDVPFNNTPYTLQTGGDVNEDDSFFYRIRCPNGSNSQLNNYMKSKCLICMGHSDHHFSSPEKISCKKIQNSSDSSWGRIMLGGDVGGDDSLYIGFFCDGKHAPIIKNWSL